MTTRILSFITLIFLLGCCSTTTTITNEPTDIKKEAQLETEWMLTYKQGNYTIEEPYLLHNPYQNSLLSYLLLFKTEALATVSYEVVGHTLETSFTYHEATPQTDHALILTGLYPGELNTVHLTAKLESGEVLSQTLEIQTEKLPENVIMPVVTLPKHTDEMTNFYLVSDDNYHYLIDEVGDIRWIQTASSGSVTPLRDGTLLTYNAPSYFYYHQGLLKRDYLGQTLQQIYVPGAAHHSIVETSNGDFLINSSDKTDERYIEDVIYLLDSNDGSVLQYINLRDYLDSHRFEETLPSSVKGDYNDWFHLNYAMIDDQDHSVIASGRSQSNVIKLDPTSKQLKWILGAPDHITPELQDYLLTPIGTPFSWPFAQHSAKVLPDLDHNSQTTDLILFDNHTDIGVFSKQNYPDLNQYSRAVHYRINEVNMTIEQLWSFGDQLTPPLFSSIISEIDYLPETNNMLVLFGFIANGNQSGGILYEVDAEDASSINFQMEFFKPGVNHIYVAEQMSPSDLNLTLNLNQSTEESLGKSNLNNFNTSTPLQDNISPKKLDQALLTEVSLQDSVLLLNGYIKKQTITDPLLLILTNKTNESYTFSISPNDCYLVDAQTKISRLSSENKRALKNHQFFQFIDRVDLSDLPKDTYHVSFFTDGIQWKTSYELDLIH